MDSEREGSRGGGYGGNSSINCPVDHGLHSSSAVLGGGVEVMGGRLSGAGRDKKATAGGVGPLVRVSPADNVPGDPSRTMPLTTAAHNQQTTFNS